MLDRLIVRVLFFFTALFHVLAIRQMVTQAAVLGVNLWLSKWTILMALMLATALFCLVALFRLEAVSAHLTIITSLPRWLGFILMPLALIGFVVIKWAEFGLFLPDIYPTLWLLIWSALVFAVGIRLTLVKSWGAAIIAATLAFGLLLRFMDWVPDVNAMPFSLGWSEASRYYYGSLLFAQRLYGTGLPLSVLHPTRYLLQAIPFIIPSLPLWAHRLWQVLLWIICTGLASWLLAKRLKLQGLLGLSVAAWLFLFLLQGAVYYHLLVCVIIVLAGFSSRQVGRSAIVIILASLWAGMSRVNWFPVPAMLGITLYLLEQPYEKSPWYKYWLAPVVWSVSGLGAAFAGQLLYINWSGNADNAKQFASSLTSNLLWYRLFPNETYPLGIILGIMIVSLPLFFLLLYVLKDRWQNWHPLRLMGLAAMLLVLFAGGLMVSVKIGGGGDLHNMDAYIVLLGIITSSLLFSHAVSDVAAPIKSLPLVLCFIAMLVPVYFAFDKLPVISNPQYADASARDTLSIVSDAITQASEKNDQNVLFITQRQLLMFGSVKKVPLIPDYEVVTLMEMAMSGNDQYLGRFYHDLETHRFSLIVADVQNLAPTDENGKSFEEEDHVWDERVGRYLLCYYEPVYVNVPLDLSLLAPRAQPLACP